MNESAVCLHTSKIYKKMNIVKLKFLTGNKNPLDEISCRFGRQERGSFLKKKLINVQNFKFRNVNKGSETIHINCMK